MTTQVDQTIAACYVAFFGRSPDQQGLQFWEAASSGLTNLALAQQVAAGFANNPSFASTYGGMGNSAFVTAIYENITGTAPDANGLQYWVNELNAGTSQADVVAQFIYGVLNMSSAAIAAEVAAGTITQAEADAATSRTQILNNKVAVALAYTSAMGAGSNMASSTNQSSLASLQNDPAYLASQAILNGVTAAASSVTAAETYLAGSPTNAGIITQFGNGTAVPGNTYTLATGVDNVTLNGNNNVVNGTLDARSADALHAASTATFTALDSIKGTGTGNTLNIVDADNTGVAVAESVPTGVAISGIQTLNLSTVNAVGTVGAGNAFDVSGFSGLQNFNVTTSTGDDFINAATTTSVSVVDTAGAVTVTGGNAVTVNTTGAVTISGAVGAISVNDNAVAANTLSIQGGTTVNVTATAAGNDGVQIGALPALNGAGTALSAATEPTGNVTVNESTTAKGITAFGTGAATIYTNGATSVSVTGTAADSITDVQTTLNGLATAPIGTSTLASVTLDGVTGLNTITSGALTSLTILDDDNVVAGGSTATVSVVNANSHALSLTVGANLVTGDSSTALLTPTTEYANVTDATATSVTVATVGTVAANVTVDAATATSLTFNNAAKVTLTAASIAADVDLTTVTASGSGALNLGDVSASAVKSINASGSTGGVTATISTSQVFQGGAGTNVITMDGALTKTSTGSITFGSGHNSLLAGVGASIGTGVVVDGGSSGANTISASLINAGNAADIKDFQILDVSNFGATNGNGALDAALLSSAVSGIGISTAETAGVATLQDLASVVTVTDSFNTDNSSLLLTHAGTASGSLAVNFADATANGAEALAIQSTGDATVSVVSGGAKGVVDTFGLTETDNHLTTLTITGSNQLTLSSIATNSAATAATANVASALTTIDGSAATGALHITAGTSVEIGVTAFDTTYTGLTIKGGVGGDTITNHATSGVIIEGATTAAHSNTLLVDGAGASINDAASAGADSLTLSGANNSATLGSGTGVGVTVSANATLSNVDSVSFGTGSATVTDHLLYGVASGNQTGATNGDMLTLGGTLHGNTLAFGAVIVNMGALGTATDVSAAQTFDQAVFLALGGTAGGAASTTTTLAANHVDWFQYAGNTYVVDAGAAGAGGAANAVVVKVGAGLVDLSHATVDGLGAGIHFA